MTFGQTPAQDSEVPGRGEPTGHDIEQAEGGTKGGHRLLDPFREGVPRELAVAVVLDGGLSGPGLQAVSGWSLGKRAVHYYAATVWRAYGVQAARRLHRRGPNLARAARPAVRSLNGSAREGTSWAGSIIGAAVGEGHGGSRKHIARFN